MHLSVSELKVGEEEVLLKAEKYKANMLQIGLSQRTQQNFAFLSTSFIWYAELLLAFWHTKILNII